MNEDWIQQEMHQRLNSVEDKVSKIEVSLENAAGTAKANRQDLQEILTMFKLQRWLLRAILLCVGFGLWLTGQINFSQISSVVDTLGNFK